MSTTAPEATLAKLNELKRTAEAARQARADSAAKKSAIEARMAETMDALKAEFQVDSVDKAKQLEARLAEELERELSAAQAAMEEAAK